MEQIKILIPTHVNPDTKSVNTLFFENILPVLQKYLDVHLIWFVYKPERISNYKKTSDHITVIDFHDYANAVELLQKEKPDLIFASATRSFIDYALSSAAKYLKIPTFSMFWSDLYYTPITDKTQYVKQNVSRFFQNSIPVDTNQNKKQRMRRGRFFMTKYLFLHRTQKALKMNPIRIFSNFFTLLKHTLFNIETDSRFSTTLHLLEDEKLKTKLITSGFDESTLLVTGNPIFDEALQKSTKQKYTIKENNNKILFAPSTLYEHGFWTQEQRDYSVKEIVNKISNTNNRMSLSVKLHPSTSILSEYTSIIQKINPSIHVYQKGGIEEFLDNIDIVITFEFSTAEVYAIIAKKPIVICNFFHSDQDILVKKGLAIECKHPSNLLESIEKSSNIPNYEKNRDNFIREFLYKSDGCASERISDAILKLLNKN